MRLSRITGGALVALSSLDSPASAQHVSDAATVRGNGASCQVGRTATLTAATLATFESGATVATLDSATLGATGARTLSEALAARLPGVSVMRSSGVLGIGSRVRMRGESGIFSARQPLLVIDGQRVEGELQSVGIPFGNSSPYLAASRLDDIDMDDIDCVIIARGPAASAPYGTDGAAGVIHVITRRAREAGTHWRGFAEGGVTTDVGDYPANFGSTPVSGSTDDRCTRADVALGKCVAGTTRSWSPLDAASPFRGGPAGRLGVEYSRRGPDRFSLDLATRASYEQGIFRRSDETRGSLRANTQFDISPTLRASVGGWLLARNATLPAETRADNGPFILRALLGNSVDDPIRRGYVSFGVVDPGPFATTERTNRLLGSASIDWTPRGWFSLRAFAGRETVNRDAKQDWFYPSQVSGSPGASILATDALRVTHATYAVTATGSYALGGALAFTTTAGVEQSTGDRRDDYVRTSRQGKHSARTRLPGGTIPSCADSSPPNRSRGVAAAS